ncbi:hypothetical protein OC835_001005 [Tilletia horrida]|nr:hypothetical protein OC835_001005 [Tilletia horrida]
MRATAVESVHLIVCVHGLWGTPEDLQYFANTLVAAGPSGSFVLSTDGDAQPPASVAVGGSAEDVAVEVEPVSDDRPTIVVRNSEANIDLTFDGVDLCGSRLAEEVVHSVHRLRTTANRDGLHRHVARVSFLGHSLGGLIARFAVGILEQKGFYTSVPPDHIPPEVEDERSRSTLAKPPQPSVFATFATPHIGMPPESRSGRPWLAKLTAATMGRTGMQLYLLDDGWHPSEQPEPSELDRPKRGVLEAMTIPGSTFMVGLNRFDRVVAYANATYDFPVAFRTASLFTSDPFISHGLSMELDPDYDGILTRYTLAGAPPTLWQKTKRKLTPPALFNPKRIPAAFPLNYLLVPVMPLVFLFLPFILALIIFFFQKYANKSTARVHSLMRQGREEEEARKAVRDEQADGNGDGDGGAGREQTADGTAAPAADTLAADQAWYARRQAYYAQPASVSEAAADPSTQQLITKVDSPSTSPAELASLATSLIAASRSAAHYPLPAILPPTERQLHVPQLRMIARWTHVLGPKFERHFVKFENVLDTHPLIVVRREANAADIRGRGVLRHFVDHYILRS